MKLVVSQKIFGGQKAWSRKRQGRLLALSENWKFPGRIAFPSESHLFIVRPTIIISPFSFFDPENQTNTLPALYCLQQSRGLLEYHKMDNSQKEWLFLHDPIFSLLPNNDILDFAWTSKIRQCLKYTKGFLLIRWMWFGFWPLWCT